MTIRVSATLLELSIDDEEGLSSLFAKWGPIGQYIDVTREEDGGRVSCELFDQTNGAEFDSIAFRFDDGLLIFEVSPPESFIRGRNEQCVEIELSKVDFNQDELASCLKHIFRPG